MPEWFVISAGIVAFGGGLFGLVNGYRVMKRTSPTEELKKEQHEKWNKFLNEKWDKAIERLDKVEETIKYVDSDRTKKRFEGIEDKLDSDNRRLKALADITRSQQRFLIMLLKSQQQVLIHFSDGNHKNSLKQVSEEIHELLLNEAMGRVDFGD
jgi:superfamily II RNA helicase